MRVHDSVRPSACLLLFLLLSITFGDEQWSRFRGKNADGNSQLSLPLQWTPEVIKWKIKTPGIGHSSPVIWDHRLFLTSGDPETGDRFVGCYERLTGAKLWQRKFAGSKHRQHQLNSFASPTPVVDADTLVVCWGSPEKIELIALNHDGKTKWTKEFAGFNSGHGFGTSPILDGERLILNVEHSKQSFTVALNKADGELNWRKDRDTNLNYATPLLRTHGQQRELILTNWKIGIEALDPKNGERLWAADVFDKSHIESSIGSPIEYKGLVIGVCGWLGHGNEVIAVKPQLGAQPKVAYRIKRGAPLSTTPLIANGRLILWTDNGIVTVANAANGKTLWQKRVGGTFYSSPVSFKEGFLNIDTRGRVTLIGHSDRYQLLAKLQLEPSHATPAITGHFMYIRTFESLYAIQGHK